MIKKSLFLLLTTTICFGQNPNYSEDIAPIIYGKCLQCHYDGGIAPLTLETYTSVVYNAGMVQHVTSNGEMPPWPADTLFLNYANENVLSMNEISTIIDWITNGVPLGDTSLLPPMPIFGSSSQLGVPDLELQMPTYSSTATASTDDYVCFSIPTGLLQNRRIKTNIVDVPDNLALEMVKNIPCRYYEYIDKSTLGDRLVIGFIAQEVREVFPIATTITTDVIPDEMRILENISWNDTTATTDLQDVSGVTYKFIVTNELSDLSNTKEIYVTGNEDNTFTFEEKYNHIFCYGKEVNDFHALHKQKLFTLNFSATQELIRKVEQLETENTSLTSKVALLESQMIEVLTRLQTLETK